MIGKFGLAALATAVTFVMAVVSDAPKATAQSPLAPSIPPGVVNDFIHLPILSYDRDDDVCDTWIAIQYLGGGDARNGPRTCADPGVKAMLVAWGEPGFCPPNNAGPIWARCTGLIAPGATWTILGAHLPPGARGGTLFSFTAARFSDVGLDDDLGFDGVVADFLCRELYYSLGMDDASGEYRRFAWAYQQGVAYLGIPMYIAAGDGRLAIEVTRRCPASDIGGPTVEASYAGLADQGLWGYDTITAGYDYAFPLVQAGAGSVDTVLYLQNAGWECAVVEVWFHGQGCDRSRLCERPLVPPGETVHVPLASCAAGETSGSAWVHSSHPIAAVADVVGQGTLVTYAAAPYEPYHRIDATRFGAESACPGATTLFAPMVDKRRAGWDTDLFIQNPDRSIDARIEVLFLGPSGTVDAVLHDWICPRGGLEIRPAMLPALPDGWAGSVKVVSRPWWQPAGRIVHPVELAGIALVRHGAADGGPPTEAAAYNLFPVPTEPEEMMGGEHGDFLCLRGQTSRLALPVVRRSGDGPGGSSHVAVMNLVAEPGFTRAGIYLFDQNGLFNLVCLTLASQQTAQVDLDRWGFVAPGFTGAALVSASFWWHRVRDPDQGIDRNPVGLAAVVLNSPEWDGPGDATTAIEAIAVTRFNGLCDRGQVLPRCRED